MTEAVVGHFPFCGSHLAEQVPALFGIGRAHPIPARTDCLERIAGPSEVNLMAALFQNAAHFFAKAGRIAKEQPHSRGFLNGLKST
jgi:hypothetical protein